MTTIRHCTCSNGFQDKTYGPGQRVHNRTQKGWRCTVCSTETAAASVATSKKK